MCPSAFAIWAGLHCLGDLNHQRNEPRNQEAPTSSKALIPFANRRVAKALMGKDRLQQKQDPADQDPI